MTLLLKREKCEPGLSENCAKRGEQRTCTAAHESTHLGWGSSPHGDPPLVCEQVPQVVPANAKVRFHLHLCCAQRAASALALLLLRRRHGIPVWHARLRRRCAACCRRGRTAAFMSDIFCVGLDQLLAVLVKVREQRWGQMAADCLMQCLRLYATCTRKTGLKLRDWVSGRLQCLPTAALAPLTLYSSPSSSIS